MNPEFEPVFTRLRAILRRHSASFAVTTDAADHFCLTVPFNLKLKKGFPAAWVQIGKGYVSYHFMPVYMFPQLRDGLSKKLRARMQGKSCFNFKTVDEPLLRELEKMTDEGFALARKMGFGPG